MLKSWLFTNATTYILHLITVCLLTRVHTIDEVCIYRDQSLLAVIRGFITATGRRWKKKNKNPTSHINISCVGKWKCGFISRCQLAMINNRIRTYPSYFVPVSISANCTGVSVAIVLPYPLYHPLLHYAWGRSVCATSFWYIPGWLSCLEARITVFRCTFIFNSTL